MDQQNPYDKLVASLKNKSTHKLKVLNKTKVHFAALKAEANKLASDLCKETECIEGIEVKFLDKGEFQAELRFAEDVLIFFLHNDVFDFDHSHNIWKNSYVEQNNQNAYCGMISVFNFLKTSFDMNRYEDVGYQIGRIFINHEDQFFVEGKRQLGFLFNDFGKQQLTGESLREIIMQAILYCQEFDLLAPPLHTFGELKVGEMIDLTNNMNLKTGKRLGFRLSSEIEKTE